MWVHCHAVALITYHCTNSLLARARRHRGAVEGCEWSPCERGPQTLVTSTPTARCSKTPAAATLNWVVGPYPHEHRAFYVGAP
jgi:hypothetical protein